MASSGTGEVVSERHSHGADLTNIQNETAHLAIDESVFWMSTAVAPWPTKSKANAHAG